MIFYQTVNILNIYITSHPPLSIDRLFRLLKTKRSQIASLHCSIPHMPSEIDWRIYLSRFKSKKKGGIRFKDCISGMNGEGDGTKTTSKSYLKNDDDH